MVIFGCVLNVCLGTARRGEDGDQNKVRRQPKPTKPKKMIKVDGQFVVHAACNNGSTALVTRDGELYMFGKDTTHVDQSTGWLLTILTFVLLFSLRIWIFLKSHTNKSCN